MESFTLSKLMLKHFKVFGHIGLNNTFTLVNIDMKNFLNTTLYQEYINALCQYKRELKERDQYKDITVDKPKSTINKEPIYQDDYYYDTLEEDFESDFRPILSNYTGDYDQPVYMKPFKKARKKRLPKAEYEEQKEKELICKPLHDVTADSVIIVKKSKRKKKGKAIKK